MRDRLEVREVEAQPLRRLVRAGLADMGAQHLAERPVQQVGGGVVAGNRTAAHGVDRQLGRRADFPGPDVHAALGGNLMKMASRLVLHRVGEVDELAVDQSRAGIARLATHFAVERRLVEDEEGVLARLHHLDEFRKGGELHVAEKDARLGVGALALGGGDDDLLFL